MNFNDANDYIKHRLSKTTALGSDGISKMVPAKIRAHCFFSARVADERILAKIREVSDAVSGGTLSQSEAAAKLRLWLRAEGKDDGSKKITNLASKARVDLILTQNQKMAVAVGKYAKDRDPVVEQRFPSWQYHCGRNARDAHRRLDGRVFLKSDPIWRKIYPPWEFNCNCWVTNSDEEPEPPEEVAKLEPKAPPASGFQFDPADAFEDFRLDKYEFGKSPPTIVHAASQARKMKVEQLKKVSSVAGDVIERTEAWWDKLPNKDRQTILDYTADDRYRLNIKHRAPERKPDMSVPATYINEAGEEVPKKPHDLKKDRNKPLSKDYDMTNGASAEMDHLSAVLESAPKYEGTTYRGMIFTDKEGLDGFLEKIENNIFGMSGFVSTAVTQDGAKKYTEGDSPYKVVLHIAGHSGVYIGNHSWIETDEEVLFDRKCHFRALKPSETGYIKPYKDENNILHIVITEV